MSRRMLFSAIMITCLSMTGFTTSFDYDNAKILEEIEWLVNNGEAKKAIKLLSGEIEANPTDLVLLSKRAELYLYVEKKKDAYSQLKDILVIDDQYAPALLTLARYKAVVNERDSSIWYVDQALSFNPDDNTKEELYSLKGRVQISMDLYEEAEESLIKAASSPQVSMETMTNLSHVLSQNGKYQEAAIILKETIELFGPTAETNINTGYVCNVIGSYDEAVDYLNDALRSEPDNPYAQSNLAFAELKLGRLDVAYKLVEKAIQNDNTNAFAYMVRGQCLLQMGENSRACKEFKKAIQMGYGVMYDQTEITKLIVQSCDTE